MSITNFPILLAGVAVVNAVGSPALTAGAMVAVVVGGFAIARRQQSRAGR